jgi:hypothetical protein
MGQIVVPAKTKGIQRKGPLLVPPFTGMPEARQPHKTSIHGLLKINGWKTGLSFWIATA